MKQRELFPTQRKEQVMDVSYDQFLVLANDPRWRLVWFGRTQHGWRVRAVEVQPEPPRPYRSPMADP
jgi:hypothetical protein